MKKGQIYTGIVETLEFPNKGIVYIEGEKAVVKHALPGQQVRFVINKKRNGRCEGRLLSVEMKSPLETEKNQCPHFGNCGGCLMQSIPYQEQLMIKEQQVKRLLDQVYLSRGTDADYRFEGIKPSPIWEGYRNKMEFSFGDEEKGGPLSLGMHKRGSFHDVVNTDHCRIVHPDFTRILTATREYFRERGIPFYQKLRHEGYLRHLLIRRGVKTGELLVALVTAGNQLAGANCFGGRRLAETNCLAEGQWKETDGLAEEQWKETDGLTEEQWKETDGLAAGREETDRELAPDMAREETALLEGWKELLLGLPLEGSFAGILHIRNDSLADVVQSDETTVLYGRDYFYEELLGLRFKVSLFSFFQTNSLGAEVLYETAREYVGDTKGKVVYDLYSGTGTIAQILAPVAEKVIGVEIVEEAVKAAMENAARNGLDNCEFIAGDVMKVIDGLEAKPDLIVLDPPRDGIHPKALERIIGFGVERMVYISCKPTSLARDLQVLLEKGYRAERVCCVDMFPGTGNVETVCSLRLEK